MDIREESLSMLEIYKGGLSQIRGNEAPENIALIDQAMVRLDQLTTLVSSVVDTDSKDAAGIQKKLFEAVNKWEAGFAYSNYSQGGIKSLDDAIKAAQVWSNAKANQKAKKAVEGDFYTTANVGTRMRNFHGTYDAVSKLEQVQHMLAKGRRNIETATNTDMLEQRKERNNQQKTTMEMRLQELTYKAQTGQISPQAALAEVKQLKPMIEKLTKANMDLDRQIGTFNSRRINRSIIIDKIEIICEKLLGYRNEPGTIVMASKEINFRAMINFLEGANNTENVNEIMNLAGIERIIEQKNDEANRKLDQAFEEQEREFEENDPFMEEQTEEQTLSDEQALAELLGMTGGAAGADAIVHPNTQYEQQQNPFSLNLSELEN